jgi:hypothetical protein
MFDADHAVTEIMNASRGGFEPLMRNRAGDGSFVTSMPVALERLARWVELGQSRDLDRIRTNIQAVALDSPEYLAQMIFGITCILGEYARARGKSFVPIIEQAAEIWEEGMPADARIWRVGE